MDDRPSQLDLITASSGSMVPFAKGASEGRIKKAPRERGLGGGARVRPGASRAWGR